MNVYEKDQFTKLKNKVVKQEKDIVELDRKVSWLIQEVKTNLQGILTNIVKDTLDVTVEDKTVDEQLRDIQQVIQGK